ncbi:hypothetical protein E0500_005295 [Streptomyces sp. KM273126]|nr:hypothetical protein [Streptomyces sp. KM273126]
MPKLPAAMSSHSPARNCALDEHWRSVNYLTAGQSYLVANPLLTEPEHIKPRLLGHWGEAGLSSCVPRGPLRS